MNPCTVAAKEIKRRTGHGDLESFLAFVALVRNGDIDKVCETISCVTLFEEWTGVHLGEDMDDALWEITATVGLNKAWREVMLWRPRCRMMTRKKF